jgi:hypothetical protein
MPNHNSSYEVITQRDSTSKFNQGGPIIDVLLTLLLNHEIIQKGPPCSG